MSINVNWANPYEDRRGQWLRGNLHAHSSPTSGCSKVPMDRLLAGYAQAGYDFLSVSDHRTLSTPPHDTSMVLIPGLEWNNATDGKHTGIYSTDIELIRLAMDISEQEPLLAQLAGRDALVILNHPNWKSVPHYRREALAEAGPFDGIEIYNFTIEKDPGNAIATEKWDFLLAKNIRVLGFASDDAHEDFEIGNGWICARSESRSADAIISALRRGNFYCSTGVHIRDITRTGRRIEVETANADQIHAVTDAGRVVQRAVGGSIIYDVPEPPPLYVRFEAFGRGPAMAWTQPFFLSDLPG